MGFAARLNFPENYLPCRAYVHTAGFTEVYSGEISQARDYLISIVNDPNSYYEDFRKSNFLLAAIWGSGKDKIVDLFGLSDLNPEKWSGNPDVSAWVFRDGVYKPDPQITCGDTLIMLGREEESRRTQPNLADYCNNYPNLGDLEPDETIEYAKDGRGRWRSRSRNQLGGSMLIG